jgi:hypothetical protein
MSAPIRLYVSGAMTGKPDLNFPLFNSESARLRALGFLVTNPAEIDVGTNPTWGQCMRADIKHLMDCDAVATLPGYEHSKGANLEVFIARELRMPVWNAEDLVDPLERAA